MYVLDVDLPEAGTWGAEFTTEAPGSAAETVRLTFDVHDSLPTVQVGQAAPASKTPTAADVGGDLAKLSTDPKPDPAFYQTSVADALAAHKPFMLVFATPKFCTSQQCGPTLDHFKPIAAANPDVTFINVEPYQLKLVDGALQPALDANNQLQATDVDGPVGPALGAVDLRGRPERRRPGLVRGHDHAGRAGRDPAGHQRGRLSDRRSRGRPQVASSRRTATISLPSVRYQTRTGWAVAWCSTR